MGHSPKDEEKSQIEKFRETTRALGADEDEAEFDKKLRQVVKPKPRPKDDDK